MDSLINHLFMRYLGVLFLFVVQLSFGQGVLIKGKIVDSTGFGLPFTAVSIPDSGKGSITNEEGFFELKLAESDLQSELKVEMIGFETYKIKVADYISKKITEIQLKEAAEALKEVVIEKPNSVVSRAIENIAKNGIDEKYKLRVLYTRAAMEGGKAVHLLDHVFTIYMKSTKPEFLGCVLTEGRQTVDYRKHKKDVSVHQILGAPFAFGIDLSLLNKGVKKWEDVGTTSFGEEDVIIFESQDKNPKERRKVYIGYDTGKVYRFDLKGGTIVSKFQTNKEGKLYLSYHKNSSSTKFHYEVIVLAKREGNKVGPVRDQKSLAFKASPEFDMPYNKRFWDRLSLPPQSKFYKKLISDIESVKGIPIQTQFENSYKLKQLFKKHSIR